jgi:two-component system sensor kinase
LVEDYADKLDDAGKQIIANIRKSADQMRKLIDDLLTFSRLGTQEIKKEYVAMGALAKDVFDELKKATPNRNIECRIQELPDARADRDTIRLVWTNLLSNAIKYTGGQKNTIIEIGSTTENDRITYFVKDNGVGFDMKFVDKLFNMFQRLHSMEEFEGTGVGLANVKRIVERHGGKAWAVGAVGEGATFSFSLPKV